jgi:AbrB family transcriptional regulator, transcriptional pleiotropic regulator of transition state genes
MKSTGIVRKVDELGRIVVPMEIRRTLGINERDPLEIFVEEDRVILQKYAPAKTCMVTGEISDSNMTLLNGKITISKQGMEVLIKELQNLYQLA